jgi:hypothetical protein
LRWRDGRRGHGTEHGRASGNLMGAEFETVQRDSRVTQRVTKR